MKSGFAPKGADPMGPIDEFEEKLDAALEYAAAKRVDGNYCTIVSTFVRKMEAHGIRMVMVAVGEPMGAHPQVDVTATTEDVTAAVVAQVVDPILRKAGVPDPMVPGFAGAAATGAVKFLERYRQYQQRQAAVAAAGARAAAGRSGGGAGGAPFKPKWDPSRRQRTPR